MSKAINKFCDGFNLLVDKIVFVKDTSASSRVIIEDIALERPLICGKTSRVDAAHRTVQIRLVVQNDSLLEVLSLHSGRLNHLLVINELRRRVVEEKRREVDPLRLH